MSLRAAKTRILADDAFRKQFEPRIENREDFLTVDDPGSERILRVHAPRVDLTAYGIKIPPLTSVCILATKSIEKKTRTFLSAVRRTNTRTVIVIEALKQAKPAIAAVNAGEAHALLSSSERDFGAQLNATIERLDQEYRQSASTPLRNLLAHGPTEFLADPTITKMIDSAARKYRAEEVYVRLDPPGVLMRKQGSPSEFLFIFDDDYRTGLREISQAQIDKSPSRQSHGATPGFSEAPHDDGLSRLLSARKASGRNKTWYWKKVRDAGADTQLFNRLLVRTRES